MVGNSIFASYWGSEEAGTWHPPGFASVLPRLAPEEYGHRASWPKVKLKSRLNMAGRGCYSLPCCIDRSRKVHNEGAVSARSNGSLPRPPRGGIHHIRASPGNRRMRDREASLLSGKAICQSLPTARRRQGCSEYRDHEETDQVNSNKPRTRILWGKNTDPVGRGEALDRRHRTVRCGLWRTKHRLKSVFQAKVRAVQRRLTITDHMGKDYRLSGGLCRPWRGRLPTSGARNAGYTDLSHKEYRPLAQKGLEYRPLTQRTAVNTDLSRKFRTVSAVEEATRRPCWHTER